MLTEPKVSRPIEDLVVATVAFIFTFLSITFFVGSFALLIFFIGMATAVIAVVDIMLYLYDLKPVKALQKYMGKFRQDKSALAWIWVVAVLTIAMAPFVYWALDWPFDIINANIAALYTFTGPLAFALSTVTTIIHYLLAIGMFFVVLWAILNAKNTGGN